MMTETAEIERFDALATDWWQEDGPMAMLHAMHPTRMAFIRQQIDHAFPEGFHGKAALDVGCGGGITAESLARLGFETQALDGSAQLIATARAHGEGLPIQYHHTMLADFAEKHAGEFDLLCALEVIEHVDDPEAFLHDCVRCLRPNGLLIISTINRTKKSRLLAIGLAEYVLHLLPVGTHDWNKFVRPSEIADALPECKISGLSGMVPKANMRDWHLQKRRVAVNYIMGLSISN